MTKTITTGSELQAIFKTLQVFNIDRPIPEDKDLSNSPYATKTKDGIVFFTVYATDLEEANTKVDEFLSS